MVRSVHTQNGAIIDDDGDDDDDDKNTLGISPYLSFMLHFCKELAGKFLNWDMEYPETGDYHSH